jgi:homoserine dehydrogenase
VAFDVSLNKAEIPVMGIRHITDADVATFKEHGLTCKILGSARCKGQNVAAFVQPTLVAADSLVASVPTNFNLISYETEYTGKMSYYGQGAGRYPTAANVVQDCLDIVGGVKDFYAKGAKAVPVCNEIVSYRYYIRSNSAKKAAVAQGQWGGAVVTAPITVAEMAKLYSEMSSDDENTFVAAIGE